ncbi:MAG: hypothetical protein DRH57_01130 [Candidatus Cloacimonadota bacterium]|nr:MAG: hypothetical protein DRH57_01130 [Candidatus Cloacimonadota bacterium]
MDTNNKKLLSLIPLFSHVKDECLDEIKQIVIEEEVMLNEIVFYENTEADTFFIVKSGRLEVIKNLGNRDKEKRLAILKKNDFFGEMSFVDNQKRSATVRAIEDSVLLKIKFEDLRQLASKNNSILYAILMGLSRRLRMTNENIMKIWNNLIDNERLAIIGKTTGRIIHDIKGPMTSILLASQYIENFSEKTKPYTKIIKEQVWLINDLIKEILDFVSYDNALTFDEQNIQQFITEIVQVFEPVCKKEQIKIDTDIEFIGKAYFDRKKMRRVVYNIVKNALEVSESGSKIKIISEKLGNRWLLKVIDYGSGIPDDIIDKIFIPFFSYGKDIGTGLGLSIANDIVQRHQGHIKVETKQGEGSTFIINLPIFPKN